MLWCWYTQPDAHSVDRASRKETPVSHCCRIICVYIAALPTSCGRALTYTPCSEQCTSVECPVSGAVCAGFCTPSSLYIGDLLSLLLYLEPAILFTFTVTSDDPDIETDTSQLLWRPHAFYKVAQQAAKAGRLLHCSCAVLVLRRCRAACACTLCTHPCSPRAVSRVSTDHRPL